MLRILLLPMRFFYFQEDQLAEFYFVVLCRMLVTNQNGFAKVLTVSERGYHKWVKNVCAPLTKKESEDIELTGEIFKRFKRYHGILGPRKITVLINKHREKSVKHKRIKRLMSENMLYAKAAKGYVRTTDASHDDSVAENLLGRDFRASSPNEKFISDTTVVSTEEGKLYIAAILNLYGRMPVGLAMSGHNDGPLVIEAL